MYLVSLKLEKNLHHKFFEKINKSVLSIDIDIEYKLRS